MPGQSSGSSGTKPPGGKHPPLSHNFKDDDFVKSGWCGNRPKCVAVAKNRKVVAVRDTKNGATLVFSREEWSLFLKGAKNNEFDV